MGRRKFTRRLCWWVCVFFPRLGLSLISPILGKVHVLSLWWALWCHSLLKKPVSNPAQAYFGSRAGGSVCVVNLMSIACRADFVAVLI